MLLNNFA